MYISFFDLFKVGIGPSSSHTMGPLNASSLFIDTLIPLNKKNKISRIEISIYGSLALTGKGHGTDLGIAAGLLGYKPHNVTIDKINSAIKNHCIYIESLDIKFNIKNDLKFDYKYDSNSIHSNKIIFSAFSKTGTLIIRKKYYSIGGGFVLDEDNKKTSKEKKVTYEYSSANKLLEIGTNKNISIANIIRVNEKDLNKIKTEEEIDSHVLSIWKEMNKSIYKGMQETGELSGKMQIKKRANYLYKRLIKKDETYDPLDVLDWVNIFAIAVSEENASFGRVVTAPTNGAAGIIPAVIKYYIEFTKESNDKGVIDFLLTASAIGGLYKNNASISGADAGCQGEVGVACSMAAAGLTSALGGSNEQIENAAEIAMEHNLGLTCDPINGMVQIPCIERNAMGAIKAINASRISLNGSGEHKVSLDEVIKTMWETGKNMNEIYKETSKGGLAVNVSEC